MLVLFETAAGYALFKVVDKGILKNADGVEAHFRTPETAGTAYNIDSSVFSFFFWGF